MYELQLTSEIEVYAIYNIVSVYFKTAQSKASYKPRVY